VSFWLYWEFWYSFSCSSSPLLARRHPEVEIEAI
jgi:hypothetical protein